MVNNQSKVSDFNKISLGPEREVRAPSRIGLRLDSTWETLRRPVLSWCRRRGLLLALSEICSCYQRIRLGRKKRLDTAGLVFDQVLASVPPLTFPRNCSETLAYTLSIETLETERPYLTVTDYELFAQAWFQAAKWYCHRTGTSRDRGESDSIDTSREAGILNRSEQFSNRPNVVS